MRIVLQRVLDASVTIDGTLRARIGRGFLALVGVREGDTAAEMQALADKIAGLRVFEDPDGKMNLSLADVGGSVLAVSNFTLYADCSHGRRPGFSGAARPETAEPLYDAFCAALRDRGIPVETGVFGADMKIALTNDGPVTLVIDAADGKILP